MPMGKGYGPGKKSTGEAQNRYAKKGGTKYPGTGNKRSGKKYSGSGGKKTGSKKYY